jgi:hypothetical protein
MSVRGIAMSQTDARLKKTGNCEATIALLRLEALRTPHTPGFEVEVSRQEKVLVRPALAPNGVLTEGPRSVKVWVDYDTIHSNLPTAEQALEQVLGFLELRCA